MNWPPTAAGPQVSIVKSDFQGAVPATNLQAADTTPASDDNADTGEASPATTEPSNTAGSTQAQITSEQYAALEKRLNDSQRFITQLLDEAKARKAEPQPAASAEPDYAAELASLGIPVKAIEAIAAKIAEAQVRAETGPDKEAKKADLYMVQNHPEYAKQLPNVLTFLNENPAVNAEVMERIEAGDHKGARLLAWSEFTVRGGGRSGASADAAAAQAERDAAKKAGGILPTAGGAKRAAPDQKETQADRIKKARMHQEATGDSRPLMVETAKALHGDTIRELAARPR